MLGMVLLNTPITEENADEDENVVTYQAFDDRSTKLFSPLVGKILAETSHVCTPSQSSVLLIFSDVLPQIFHHSGQHLCLRREILDYQGPRGA